MLYTRKQAAEALGISTTTLDKLRAERKIGYYQMHSRCWIRFSQAHLDQYLKALEKTPSRMYSGENISANASGKTKVNRL